MYDHRLCALIYDSDNRQREDLHFYEQFVDRIDAKKMIDLGCGTGLLTTRIASNQREIIGIDPSRR